MFAYPAAGFVLLVFVGLLPETGAFRPASALEGLAGETLSGTVLEVVSLERTPSGTGMLVSEQFAVEFDGETVTVERRYLEGATESGGAGARGGAWPVHELSAGDGVLVQVSGTPSGPVHYIVDRQRGVALWVLAGAFALFVVLLGRWHGLGALLRLGVSVLVIGRFVIPGILAGRDPMVIANPDSLVPVCTTLLLPHG